MTKQLIFITLCAALALPAAAQQPAVRTDTTVTVEYTSGKYSVETTGVGANWFITVGGGAQILFGDHDKQCKLGDRLSPALNVSVGKWITPTFGLRLSYSGLSARGATQKWAPAHSTGVDVPDKDGHGYWLEKQKFNFFNAHADALLNFSNILCGYKPDRFWNCSPYIGIGWARVYDSPTAGEISANGGFSNDFRLSDAWSVNLDVRGMYVNDRFDGEEGGRWGEGILSATVGLTYNIAPRGWGRTKVVTKVEKSDISSYQVALASLKAEKERLEKELAQLRSNTRTVEKVSTVAAPYYVTFEIGKSTLTKEARVNLGMLAEILKANNTPFVVSGYADAATGNTAINEKLSRERAQAVYDCLVNEFGVPASLLTIDPKGGVGNMFYDDPALSRAVITRSSAAPSGK